ncbi:MAG: hypothetical protein AAFW87_12250 [Pseudomonadota bacterium]
MTRSSSSIRALKIAAGVAVVFGALTILSGGRALFGGEVTRAAMGDAVPFVLWFNFLAGFAYVIAGIGMFLQRRSAVWLSLGILTATAAVFIAFGVHVYQGGAFEMRTVGAMILRTGVWAAISIIAWRQIVTG